MQSDIDGLYGQVYVIVRELEKVTPGQNMKDASQALLQNYCNLLSAAKSSLPGVLEERWPPMVTSGSILDLKVSFAALKVLLMEHASMPGYGIA